MKTMNNNANILKIFVPCIVALFVIIFDQISKIVIEGIFDVGNSVVVIPNVLNFTYVKNTGAAFSMLTGHTTFLIIFTAVVMVGCVYVIIKDVFDSTIVNWALFMCLGGGIGNMIDRIRLHYVVDFIECKLIEFPVFNIADIAVTIGGCLMGLYIIKELFFSKKESKPESN